MSDTTVDTLAALRSAIEHHRSGRLREAEALCRQVLRGDPNHPTALNLLGIIARQAGRPDAAAELLRRALAKVPEFADAYYNLGNALRDCGDRRGAVAAYDSALALKPEMAGWHNNRGVTLLDDGDAAAAELAFRRALSLKPDYAEAHSNLGNALSKQERLGDAIAAYRRAAGINPRFAGALANLGGALIKAGDTAAALEPLDGALKLDRQHVRATAYKAIALRELGRDAEADYLENVDLLVGSDRPPAPPGYASIAAFNETLIADIRVHPTLKEDWDPYQRAARHGSVAVDLLAHKTPSIAAFEAMIRGAIDAFARRLPDDPRHPFLCRKPRAYSLIVWANILKEEGHQASHIHNLGWLSGVYYPMIPPAIRDGDPEHLGWIEFGMPGYDLPCRYAPKLRRFKPENGLMFMFPSYFWHRTIPFRGAAERISVAFDLHARA
jgi:Tfp pilus assembly protein PilF